VLEIACGTGIRTWHLAACARSVTALDAAPQMIALARQRVVGQAVTFVAADVLGWTPPRRFDTVFRFLAVARALAGVRPVLAGCPSCTGRRRPCAVRP
jgi:trans-aconitate methyltransferase